MPKRKSKFGCLNDSDYDSDYSFGSDDSFKPKASKKSDKADKSKKKTKKDKDKSSKKQEKSKSRDEEKRKSKDSQDSIILIDDDDDNNDNGYSVKETPLIDGKCLKVTIKRLPDPVELVGSKVDEANDQEEPTEQDTVHETKANYVAKREIDKQDIEEGKTCQVSKEKSQTKKPKETTKESAKFDCSEPLSSPILKGKHTSGRSLRETKSRSSAAKYNPLQFVEPVRTPPINIRIGLSRNRPPKKHLHPLLARGGL